MQKQPLVTVLMTAYNREKYISQAIESVIASTYQNWELIIVDDVSIDNTVEIAKSYQNKDNRIKVYVNNRNLGDYPNRNKAASYAKGKYIKYVDSDDLIYPYGLEQLVFYMEQFPDAAYGLCSLSPDTETPYPFQLSPQQAYRRHYINDKWTFHKAPLSSIIKKEYFDKTGGFSGKQYLGDFELWNILSQKYNVVLMPEGIIWYRTHQNQQYTANKTNPAINLSYIVLQHQLLESEDCPLSESEKRTAIRKTERMKGRYILRHLKSHGFAMSEKLRKQCEMSWFQVFAKAFQKP